MRSSAAACTCTSTYPEPRLEARIVDVHVPGIDERLRAELVAFVQQLRKLELKKLPSVSETIDWARVMVLLHAEQLGPALAARRSTCC